MISFRPFHTNVGSLAKKTVFQLFRAAPLCHSNLSCQCGFGLIVRLYAHSNMHLLWPDKAVWVSLSILTSLSPEFVCVCVCVCVCRWCKRGKQAFGPKHCEAREGETQDVSKLNAIFAPIALFYYLHNYLKYKTLLFIMHLFLFLGETTLR